MSQTVKVYPVKPPLPFQTPGEEIANAVLHGFGVIFAITGLVLFTVRVQSGGGADTGALALVSYLIFTGSMFTMFLASTLYHAIRHEEAKRVFRVLDHSSIYFLIAGTYTPFCLLGLKGAWGWSLFGFEWVLAVAGISLHAVNFRPLKKVEVIIYIFMGWAIAAFWFKIKSLPPASIVLLVSGGAAYTLGIFFYSLKNRRGAHVIWHVFVLAGAVCHWCAIWALG
ncbi:MAG: hemolysin III family protein [Treponema sp.]|jgi:hemolysin III|nr:hemolysin III family protein [Treponema sp.]